MHIPITKGKREQLREMPSFTGGKGKNVDQRISVCTDCRFGIYKYQEYKWTGRGLVHTPCDEGLDETEDVT